MQLAHLYIGTTSSMNRGVFTSENIQAGMVVEEAPVLVMTGKEREWLDKTLLHDYTFEWGETKEQCCMALGYVPIYNHSYGSNCEYEMDYINSMIRIRAVRQIHPGEELFINYNGDWNDETPVWFETK